MAKIKIHLLKRRILLDGTVLSALFGAFVVISLYVDARLWVQDYPPDIRAVIGDSLKAPLYERIIAGVLFLLVVFGGLLFSNRLLRRQLGVKFSFANSFVHTFLLFWFLNIFDVFIVDWLFFVTIQPDFVILPGTEGMAGYRDYYFHFHGSFLNWIPWTSSIIISAIVASVSFLYFSRVK